MPCGSRKTGAVREERGRGQTWSLSPPADGSGLRPHGLPAPITRLITVGVPADKRYRLAATFFDTDPRFVPDDSNLGAATYSDFRDRLECPVTKLPRSDAAEGDR